MSNPQFRNWQAIQTEVLRRIHARDWPPGHTIPNEADLAQEFGCARATVNRALQSLADAGMLERRRKAGTRVALHPISKATVDIPVIRQEIEARGKTYGYRLIAREIATPPAVFETSDAGVHITALHRADGAPYVLEDRWINTSTVPAAIDQAFEDVSANEWLVTLAPYTHGDISFTADAASAFEAEHLQTQRGAPVFVINRITWEQGQAVTSVRLTYAPGYRIRSVIGAGIEAGSAAN